jgi:DNA-binding transcriptional LysR family regulator
MTPRPRIELRQLHYFLAVAEAGSISGAAHALHLSQPPLTTQVRQLESLIGAPLLLRHKRGVTPTAAGELLAKEARSLLAQAGNALERVQQVGRGEVGVLRIGMIGSLMWSDFQPVFKRFQEQYPRIVCTLIELNAEPQIEALTECRIDIGVWRTPLVTGDHITSTRLASETICVALPAGHPLERRRPLRLEHLAG